MAYLITCRPWQETDLPHLLSYLHHLSKETKDLFGPHPFTLEALQHLYHHPDYVGFLITENDSTYIIGYAILKIGYLEHDLARLNSYNIQPNHHTDATYAPSLADDWQGKGIGKLLWDVVKTYLQQHNKRRVILWGGVQISNTRAVKYYESLGFLPLGTFEYGGINNLDMMYLL